MLKRLYIDNFRYLSNLEIRPERVAALVGANGSGKSAVFDVLRALSTFLNAGDRASLAFPPWSLTRWDTRRAQRFEVEIENKGKSFRYNLTLDHQADDSTPAIREEELIGDGDLLYRYADGLVELYGDEAGQKPRTSFPYVGSRSFLPMLERRHDNQRIFAFKDWFSGVYLFALNPWVFEFASQRETPSIAFNGENFVSWYRSLVQESPGVEKLLREDLEPIIPGLSEIQLRQNGPYARVMNIHCETGGQPYDLNVTELSEGQKILLALYTILHTVAPSACLLVFDEPDNFVAQAEIQPWLSALRDATTGSNPGTLLVISHHPEVINYLAADEALFFWRTDEGPTRVKKLADELDRAKGLSASEWLMLGAGRGD